MLLILLCIEEDKFIPEFTPPDIFIENFYFERKKFSEINIGIGNNFDIVNFLRFNENYIYGIYLRKRYLFENVKMNLERFYGNIFLNGEPMNPYFKCNSRLLIPSKIPIIFDLGFSGFKDSILLKSSMEFIVPFEEFLFGFSGGYGKRFFSGIFLQSNGKRITIGMDLIEFLIFSDFYFISLRYSYDFLPYYDFWFGQKSKYFPVTSIELLLGIYYLKTGITYNKLFFYFRIKNSEIFFYDRKISITTYNTISNRFFSTRFFLNNSTDYKKIKGSTGIFIIPEKKYLPFIGIMYNFEKYWRLFAGLKLK
jgi:hypothetical protein